MHFIKIFTLVAFLSLVIAATIPNELAERAVAESVTLARGSAPLVSGTGPFQDVEGTQAAWANLAALCAGGNSKKRDLENRATPPGFVGVEVFQGRYVLFAQRSLVYSVIFQE